MVPHLSGRGRRILRGCVRWCWPVVDVMAVYLESPRSRVEKDVVSERKILVEVLGVRFRKVVARTRICVDHVVSTGMCEWGVVERRCWVFGVVLVEFVKPKRFQPLYSSSCSITTCAPICLRCIQNIRLTPKLTTAYIISRRTLYFALLNGTLRSESGIL